MKLYAKIEFVSGAPVLVTSEVLNAGTSPVTINPSQGFQSLTTSGAGIYTLVLGANNGGVPTYDTYARLLNVSGSAVFGPSSVAPTDLLWAFGVTSEDVAGVSGNPSLTFSTVFLDGMGNPAIQFPTDGTVLLVEVTLSNTTAY